MATQKKYVSLEKLAKYDDLLKAKIKADDQVVLDSAKSYADSLASEYDAAGAAATAQAAAIEAAKTETTTQVNALANGQVETNKKAIEAIKDGSTIDSFADVEAALAGKQATGDYATKTEAQGYADAKDTAIQAAKDAADAAQDTADANAEAIEAINNTDSGILAQAKSFATTEDAKVQAVVDALADKVGTVPEGSTVMGIITNIQESAYDDTNIQAKIDGVSGKVDTLVGADTGKSVRAIAAEELAAQLVADGAAESLDTLEEIAAWIQSHPDDASAMNEAILALQTKVVLGTDGEGKEYATVKAYVEAAIAALSIGDYAKAADLTALAGRVTALETASATHALKTEVEAVSDALTEYKNAHNSDYTNAQIDTAIKAVADDVAALNDTYASDDELAAAIEAEVTRANGAYAAKSLETTVANLSATVDTKAAQSEVNTISGKVGTLETDMAQAKTDIDAVEAKAATNETNIGKKADKATTLAGYGIADAYTSTQTDTAIANAFAQFVECSEEDINGLFASAT